MSRSVSEQLTVARGRIVRYLGETLGPFSSDPELVELEVSQGLASVDALETLGLFSQAEAATWRARFERARARSSAHKTFADGSTRERARAYLERELKQLNSSGDEACFERFWSAVEAFEEVGVFSARERAAWYDRGAEFDPLIEEEEAELDPDRARLALSFSGRDIVRVIPGPEERASGLRVTAVVLFEDGLRFEWHMTGELAAAGHEPNILEAWEDAPFSTGDPISLTDDVGTTYAAAGDGRSWGAGENPPAFGYTNFAPAVPATATVLHVDIAGGGITVPL
jgi:hypothetical protein